jgi:hypothetical protein
MKPGALGGGLPPFTSTLHATANTVTAAVEAASRTASPLMSYALGGFRRRAARGGFLKALLVSPARYGAGLSASRGCPRGTVSVRGAGERVPMAGGSDYHELTERPEFAAWA